MESDHSLSEFSNEDIKPEMKEEVIDEEEESVTHIHSVEDQNSYFSSMEWLDDERPDNMIVTVDSKKEITEPSSITVEELDCEQPPQETFTTSRSGRLVKRMCAISPTDQTPRQPKRKKTSTPLPSSQRHCLLCYRRTYDSNTGLLATSIVERDFQVMFVLKKMLSVPQENLTDYVLRFGNPREWINFCDHCSPQVVKAIDVQKEINRLEETLRNYQAEMKQKIKSTQGKGKKKTPATSCKDVIRVTNETRDFIATGKCTMFQDEIRTCLKTNTGGKKKKRYKVTTSRLRSMRTKKGLVKRKATEMLKKITAPITEETYVSDDEKIQKRAYMNFMPVPPSLEPSAVDNTVNRAALENGVVLKTDDVKALKKICYHCEICPNIKGMNSTFFSHHVLYHHKRPYRCTECGLFFTSTAELELDACPINAIRKENGETHICSSLTLEKVNFEPKNIWSCDYCAETFNFDFDRDSHEKICSFKTSSKNDDIDLKNLCTICKNSYRNIAEWRIHMSLDHPEVASLSCYYCDSMFAVKTKEEKDLLDYEEMKNHLIKSHSNRKFPKLMTYCCDFCGQVFRTTTALCRHVEVVHKIDKMKGMACELCSYRGFNRFSIQQHQQRIHYSEKKTYICEACGFKTVNGLKFDNHKLSMHKIQPAQRSIFKCSVEGCDFETVANVKLKKHVMKMHNAARKITCDDCGKGFLSNQYLRRHKEIHLNKNKKPFQCEICGNSFGVKNYLYIHMRLSHQNRPFASTHKKKPTRRKNVASIKTVDSTDGNGSTSFNCMSEQPIPLSSQCQPIPTSSSFNGAVQYCPPGPESGDLL